MLHCRQGLATTAVHASTAPRGGPAPLSRKGTTNVSTHADDGGGAGGGITGTFTWGGARFQNGGRRTLEVVLLYY